MANEMLSSEFYSNIKEILETARKKAYAAINFAMGDAYWEIGKRIVEMEDGNKTAKYDKQLIKELS